MLSAWRKWIKWMEWTKCKATGVHFRTSSSSPLERRHTLDVSQARACETIYATGANASGHPSEDKAADVLVGDNFHTHSQPYPASEHYWQPEQRPTNASAEDGTRQALAPERCESSSGAWTEGKPALVCCQPHLDGEAGPTDATNVTGPEIWRERRAILREFPILSQRASTKPEN